MKSGKVKNPCKICCQSVSNKTGLRCKGQCKKWAHFKCLNYTPGKICDIKAGLIEISCPCPDCATSEEDLTNLPDTCLNQYCPGAKLPSSESIDSPSKRNPVPQFENPQNPARSKSQERFEISTQNTAPKSPPLRKSSLQDLPASAPRRPSSRPRSPTSSPKSPASSPRNQIPPPRRPGSPQKCKTTCKLPCPLHCPKRALQNIITDKQLSPQRSQSCSIISTRLTDSDRPCVQIPRAFSSHDQKMLFNTMEELCNTVGQLSNQIRGLMCKMMTALENRNRS